MARHRAEEKARLARLTDEQRAELKARRAEYYQANRERIADKSRVADSNRKRRKGPVRTMSHDECVYLAGLFDGEGCFSIHTSVYRGSRKLSARVRIAMSHRPTMDWVAAALGVYVTKHGLGHRRDRVSKPMYRVAIEHVEGIESFLIQVLPYLIAKREVAEVLLAFCRARIAVLRVGRGTNRAAYSNSDFAQYERLRELNRIGIIPVTH